MDCKIVVRLMDAEGRMLGWAETSAHARGDGKLWIEKPVAVPVIEDGNFEFISSHWTEMNIEVRLPVPEGPVALKKGTIMPLTAPWAVFDLGAPAGGLPPVTIGHNVAITVPTGVIAAVGHRG